MKKLILLLILSTSAFAQDLKVDDVLNKYGGKTYKLDTIVNSDLKKEFLYSNALAWLSSSFKDSRNVVESKDADLGEIIFKGNTSGYVDVEIKKSKKKTVTSPVPVRLSFSGKIIVKDGKYRVIFNNLVYTYITDGLSNDLRPEDKTLIDNDEYNSEALRLLDKLNISLLNSMNKKSDNDF